MRTNITSRLSENRPNRGGQAHFAPRAPQNEPVPAGSRIGSYSFSVPSVIRGSTPDARLGRSLALPRRCAGFKACQSHSVKAIILKVAGCQVGDAAAPVHLGGRAVAVVVVQLDRQAELVPNDGKIPISLQGMRTRKRSGRMLV